MGPLMWPLMWRSSEQRRQVMSEQKDCRKKEAGKNGSLDVATDVEVVRAKRPGNVRAKGRLEEGGRDK
jgi:hypothetical protein